jgi:hypothetical protein
MAKGVHPNRMGRIHHRISALSLTVKIGALIGVGAVGALVDSVVSSQTIVYMALENTVGADLRRRWIIAGLFGLVHGFGFADILREQLQFAGSRPGAYERIFGTGRELMGALTELLKRNGLTAQVIGEPPLFDAVFAAEPVHDYRGALRGDVEMLRRFNALLRERGVLKGESKHYVSLAHTPEDIRHTCDAWASAIEALVAR